MRIYRRLAAALFVMAAAAPRSGIAQERGAAALDQMVRGLTTTGRVLMVGAHPDDEDTPLIIWLTRGHQVETAYLSLTRGDGGQNLIGNELGETLGAIRTEELLAARRLDGGRQYFTRAYDFGFSKTAEETFKHWNHDSLLGDVVTVIRAFRPHVIVAVFSGTPADGHGHHQVSAILAREAYDAAADTVRFPPEKFGQAWIPLKFYRSARGSRAPGTLGMNVGEYDPVLGRSYAEIAGDSRSQHRSQGFGAVQRKGAQMGYVLRLASRVNEETPAANETSMFDGVDTTFARLSRIQTPLSARGPVRGRLATAAPLADSARLTLDLHRPSAIVPWLAKVAEAAQLEWLDVFRCPPPDANNDERCDQQQMDIDASLEVFRRRSADALLQAAGIAVEVLADSELVAFGDSMAVRVSIYNRGKDTVTFVDAYLTGARIQKQPPIIIAPDSALRFTRYVSGLVDTRPWWIGVREGDMFTARVSPANGVARVAAAAATTGLPGVAIPEDIRRESDATVIIGVAGVVIRTSVGPIIHRYADPVLGEQQRPVGGVPPVTLEFDQQLEWVPAAKPIDRLLRLTVKSFAGTPITVAIKTAVAPEGIRVDSLPPALTLQPGEQREIFVRLRGSLKAGRSVFGVYAETWDGAKYAEGFREIDYAHIRPIRIYHSSAFYVQAVDITVPAGLSVAYVQGVGDVVALYLRQLGIPVAVLSPSEIDLADLSRYSTVVVGTRAYQANHQLIAYNSRLFDFARKGGTLIVQYGQNEMMGPGVMPYPVRLNRPTAARVTEEDAPVTILDPKSRVLNWPNRIGDADWANWVQERALYMPSVIDPHYATPLEMHDPKEPDNKGALLITPLGKGMYIYTTLSLFRQIPGGVPGGPRLFVNLLSAGLDERVAQKVQP
jgi:LmbE family N-acetylglucosaminyl deacetylase